ncbi:hypothetical protein R3P38DRAFT_3242175 [Favolaschia claudopus]|uniref:Uncharacterized protein n=1 Tax=Favolaschia claudopus TaxID=2862362 RepID=A0AAV9Z4N4_9AGAR
MSVFNDAVAQLGKVGSGELDKVGEYCTSVKQEIEADVVSARLDVPRWKSSDNEGHVGKSRDVFAHRATTYTGVYLPSRPAFARAAVPNLVFTPPCSRQQSAPQLAHVAILGSLTGVDLVLRDPFPFPAMIPSPSQSPVRAAPILQVLALVPTLP